MLGLGANNKNGEGKMKTKELIEKAHKTIFDGRGFNREKAEQFCLQHKLKFDSISRGKPEFTSGSTIYHPNLGVWRIYSGNRAVTARRDRHTYYIYDFIEIPEYKKESQNE